MFFWSPNPSIPTRCQSCTYLLLSPSSLSAFWNQPKSLASICNSSSFQGLLGPFSLLESAKPSAAIYNSSSFQGLLGQTFLFLISSPLGLLESSYFLTLWDFWNLLISSPFETFGNLLFPHPLRLMESSYFLTLWDFWNLLISSPFETVCVYEACASTSCDLCFFPLLVFFNLTLILFCC